MSDTAVTGFDVCGDLPSGTTVLEASAGTGKTYTIAALAARYVAEGVAELGELMLVTFGRMATTELRQRVRDRLVALESRLALTLDGRGGDGVDDLEQLLCTGSPPDLQLRLTRVSRALTDFDAATIATTHEFCLQMLDGLGVLGDREPQARFVEHLTDLTHEVVTDLYLRGYAATADAPLAYDDARTVADRVVEAGHTRLVPEPATEGSGAAGRRVALFTEVRREVERRKRSGRLFTYDDMLTRLRDALADPEHGAAAAARLRSRFRIVMVDEFQDTDPVQWEILRRAFHGHTTLVLIGDPKQAIYAFRGADVYSYLEAVRQADRVQTLATNWRTDQALVDALQSLMGGAALGEPEIVVRPVRADHQQRRLTGPLDAPLRLRVRPHEVDAEQAPGVGRLRPQVQADLVADVTALLASDARLTLDGTARGVQAADIAVLVRTNQRGEAIRDALVAAGVPAVMHGASSVFASDMAQDWLTLLKALEQPRQGLVRQAALTRFVGWTFAELALASEDDLIDLSQRMRQWSRILAARGVAALLETAVSEQRVPERLLATVGGERQLTDLRHLGQSLHAAMTGGSLGVNALVEWLQERMAETRGHGLVDGTRRLETDAAAVTIVTVHRSKGLEFPIVYLPEAWDRFVNGKDEGGVLRLHEPAEGRPAGDCVLDVGGRPSPGRDERFSRHRQEDSGEDLRLLYVALTRAQCQVVTWWAPSFNTPGSALQRFLYRSATEGVVPEPSYPLSGDPSTLPTLGPGVSVETLAERPVLPPPAAEAPSEHLSARRFDRTLDLEWRRTSYSALTAAVHGVDLHLPGVGSEPEPRKEDDEPRPEDSDSGATSAVAAGTVRGRPTDPTPVEVRAGAETAQLLSPMRDLPSGVDFGTAVHSVFETVDATAADLPAAIRSACATILSRGPGATMTVDQLADGLLPVFLTPLGPLADDLRLADIAPADQLAELGFEIPLAGGEHSTAHRSLGMLAPVLRRHLPADDPLAGYPDLLEHPLLSGQSLRGYLNGSIDAVLRLRSGDGTARYLVVDYKTNWLGGFDGQVLTLDRYTPPRLAEAMMEAHYPLQALLYSVAVHRMLRWRQPGYDPDRHLGGVLYLFVRGMAGPQTPRVDEVPCGVFSWRPAPAMIVELSELLDGGTR
ncbi:MAG: family ATPase [Friedmanniella sp.]|nr:family ATPase [Friedmanniella sp.]